MRKHLARASRDTLRQAGHLPGIILLVGVPVLTLAAHLLLFGEREMLNEVSPVISTFAALGLTALLMFLWNLFSSPYKHQKERANEALSRVSATEEQLAGIQRQLDALQSRKKNIMTYKGYQARVDFDPDDGIIVGRIAGIDDNVSFHADSVSELIDVFHEAVDDYLETRAEIGKELCGGNGGRSGGLRRC